MVQAPAKPTPKPTPTAAQADAMQAAIAARQALDATVKTIAAQLGETEVQPLKQLKALVQHLGTSVALGFLQEALDIEAAGGLLTCDGARRRTLGGIWFYLVRTKGPKELRRLFYAKPQPPKAKATRAPAPAPLKSTPFTWATRLATLDTITTKQQGEITKLKVTLMGHPGRIITRGSCVVTSMRGRGAPDLPAGLPLPPREASTSYTVYIAAKQWQRVKEALDEDPEDQLLVEGWPHYDEEAGGIAVFVSRTTTKKIQQGQRQAMQVVAAS